MSRRFAMACMVGFTLAPGCDFFEELKSAPDSSDTDSTDTDGGTGATDTGACVPREDDRCLDQDKIQMCQPDGTTALWDCGAICGQYVNVTCLPVGGENACWCVESGLQKVLSCSELEQCLERCGPDAPEGCADRCFSRTLPSVARMYGAVVHCAYQACREPCMDGSADCPSCVALAMAGRGAGCALERSVCDEDKNDEEDF